MSNAWIMLIVAGLLEVGWAIGIKYTDGFNYKSRPLACVLTIMAMIASMYLLAQAIRTIPVGTGYAIWTGIGALGAATLGIILFQEPATWPRLLCLLMLVGGILGLKMTTPHSHGATTKSESTDVFIGGYGKGVYQAKLDLSTGALTTPTLLAEVKSASFLAHHPTLPILYCVSEVGSGSVIALRENADGTYSESGRQSAGGNGPCHLSIHPSGRAVLVANYGDGTVALLPLDVDGSFTGETFVDQHVGSGPNEKRQDRAYAHSIYPHPDGVHILSADLGCDAVFINRIDFENGTLVDKRVLPLVPGSGPRHLAIGRDGRFVYVVGELSNTVQVLQWSDGSPFAVQTVSTLPDGFAGTSHCAEIRLHPNGKFLYVSNRGADSIATFAVNSETGRLQWSGDVPSGGSSPRGMEIDPTGAFLLAANQKSDLLSVFRIDAATGLPSPVAPAVPLEKPACVRFAASAP